MSKPMNNRRRIFGIAAAVLLALVGTLSLVSYVRSAKDKAVADEALVGVYIVDEFVPKGAEADVIRSSVSIEQIPARLKQTDAITDLATLGDDVAAADLEPGDQLVAARLASRDAVSDEVNDKVRVSALLAAERAVGGEIKKGDLVGVYLSFVPFDLDVAGETGELTIDGAPAVQAAAGQVDTSANPTNDGTSEEAAAGTGPTKTPNMTRLEFQHVLVTNVQTTNAPVSTQDDDAEVAQVSGTQYVVTLALSPEQSERFVFAAEFGKVWLSLDPATVTDDGSRRVTLGNVYTVVN
jgi:pilus assembly protein CpaB